MAICIDCIHGDVCRNAYTLKVEPPNVCGSFKNKADFVEVVRCKDCKHKEKTTNEYCTFWYKFCASDNNFCSYGERKDGKDINVPTK